METKTFVASAVIVIALIALLFTVVSNVLGSSENDITEEGNKYNDDIGCAFENPEEAQKCREPTGTSQRLVKRLEKTIV